MDEVNIVYVELLQSHGESLTNEELQEVEQQHAAEAKETAVEQAPPRYAVQLCVCAVNLSNSKSAISLSSKSALSVPSTMHSFLVKAYDNDYDIQFSIDTFSYWT